MKKWPRLVTLMLLNVSANPVFAVCVCSYDCSVAHGGQDDSRGYIDPKKHKARDLMKSEN